MANKFLIFPILILVIFLYLLIYLMGLSKPAMIHTEVKSAKTERHISKAPNTTITLSPTPTVRVSSPSPTTSPTIIRAVENSSAARYLLDQVNAYRASQGLSASQMDSNTCAFAAKRAEQIKNDFSHNGFQPVPYARYSKVTENIAMNSDYKNVVSMWINSPGHAENMRADTPFICIIQNGNYFALEGWKP